MRRIAQKEVEAVGARLVWRMDLQIWSKSFLRSAPFSAVEFHANGNCHAGG